MTIPIAELAGLTEAEEFFEALAVPYAPEVLAAHRLHILKIFGMALTSWLDANPGAEPAARRAAAARALREAHAAFADEARAPGPTNPFAPGLVQLGRVR
jgi:nitrogenase-stabilizing/protective protein